MPESLRGFAFTVEKIQRREKEMGEGENIELRHEVWREFALDISKVNKISDALADEESQILFDARINYLFSGDEDKYFDVIESLPHKWKCAEMIGVDAKTEIIIFGCGHDGRKTNKILKRSGYEAKCFCDSNLFGKKVDGMDVISLEELFEKHAQALVVLGSAKYSGEMFWELKTRGWSENRIIKPKYGIIRAKTGKKQYFDFFPCGEDEVFVDAGAYDGETALDFVSWTDKKYSKVFVLEPLSEMCGMIERKVEQKGLNNFVIRNCAAWNKEEKLYFAEDKVNQAGSKTGEEGDSSVQGMSIDNIVGEEKITYIKMDIEGSEFKALQGAKQTILRNKPKLAICIYHKPGDIVVLASYILGLVPEYKLGIRHYCSNMWETVLYAY